MATCGFCGGRGRVAAGGITSQLAGVFGMDVRPCGHCQGTGRHAAVDRQLLPRQRVSEAKLDLSGILTGEWVVEVHGLGRISAVLRFVLTGGGPVRRFDARCEYGGLPEWQARGEWMTRSPGNVIRLSGAQSSPLLLTAGYRWAVTLEELGRDVLHGESISHELTLWSRKLNVATETVPGEDRATAGAEPRAIAIGLSGIRR